MNKKLIVMGLLALIASYVGLRERARAPAGKPASSTPAVTQRQDIASLTSEQRVVSYLQQHQRLPDYYIGKNAARRQGWDPARGNLCQVLPGRAIGGDRFSNREGSLPEKQGRNWFEADTNYRCGHRGSDRLLWSTDGMIYATHDHYRHFERIH